MPNWTFNSIGIFQTILQRLSICVGWLKMIGGKSVLYQFSLSYFQSMIMIIVLQLFKIGVRPIQMMVVLRTLPILYNSKWGGVSADFFKYNIFNESDNSHMFFGKRFSKESWEVPRWIYFWYSNEWCKTIDLASEISWSSRLFACCWFRSSICKSTKTYLLKGNRLDAIQLPKTWDSLFQRWIC